MKTFENQAAQGDLLIRKIDKLPEGTMLIEPKDGNHILAHSETMHNHVVKAAPNVRLFGNVNDNFLAYLVVDNEAVEVEHIRSFDTHESIKVKPGIYEIRRQREYMPEGFRRVAD